MIRTPGDDGAETIRAEMAGRLRAIAGSRSADETVKAAINRAARKLAHPELTPGLVKRLWYGEVQIVPAHLADHIRRCAENRPSTAFAIGADGRIRALDGLSGRASIVVRADDQRVTIEVSSANAPYGGIVTLRGWLLGLVADRRPFRLVDLDRGTLVDVDGALPALYRLEDMLIDQPGRPAALIDGRAMIAEADGLKPLDDDTLERLGVAPDANYDVPRYLARNLEVIVFLPEQNRLTVLARARGRSAPALDQARAWLAAQPGPVRLRIWWEGAWINEVIASGSAAAARLYSLCRLGPAGTPPPSYHGKRVRADEIADGQHRALGALLAMAGESLDREAYAGLLAQGLGDRLWILEVADGGARFVSVPPGPDYYGKAWWVEAVGTPVGEQPDRVYGQAIEERIVEAVNEGTAHVERVQARIVEQGDHGVIGDARFAAYSRVVVPCYSGKRRLALSYTWLNAWLTPPRAGE